MSVGIYTLMVLALGINVLCLAWSAARLRARLLPAAGGAFARLVESVLALAGLLISLELAGIAGFLFLWPTLLTIVLISTGVAIAAGPPDGGGLSPDRRRVAVPTVAAVAIALLVLFMWTDPTVTSYQRGITNGDTLWYHLTLAARFAQAGSITGLDYTGGSYLSWFYPANGELFQSWGILLAGHHDILAAAISLLWPALALLAAWCIGRPFGAGLGSVLAVAVLLGSPLVLQREPGGAHTDVAALAFFLCAVAVLAGQDGRGGAGVGRSTVAALAAGLAAGTKLTLLPAVAVLAVGAVLLSRGRRGVTAGVWSASLLATGSFWYLRNLAYTGNPLPWVRLGAGPFVLAAPSPDHGGVPHASVAHYATDPSVWHRYFAPELHSSIGALWPLLVVAAALGLSVALLRGTNAQRVIAAAGIAAALGYLFNPLSAAGPQGNPITFESNLRYALPGLALGLVLFVTVVARSRRAGWPTLVGLGTAMLVNDHPLAIDPGRALPDLGVFALGALVAIAWLLAMRGARRMATTAVAVAVLVCAVGGLSTARAYLAHMYRGKTDGKLEAAHLNAAFRWASHVREARIATTSILQFGLYGSDLSNVVRYVGIPGPRGSLRDPAGCRSFRTALDADRSDYLVLAAKYEGAEPEDPRAWVRSPQARLILHSGPMRVYRLSGALAPAGCRAALAGPTGAWAGRGSSGTSRSSSRRSARWSGVQPGPPNT